MERKGCLGVGDGGKSTTKDHVFGVHGGGVFVHGRYTPCASYMALILLRLESFVAS